MDRYWVISLAARPGAERTERVEFTTKERSERRRNGEDQPGVTPTRRVQPHPLLRSSPVGSVAPL